MNQRGQITIEGLLLFGAFILIFIAFSFPHALTGFRASYQIAAVQETQNNMDRIMEAVELAKNGGPGTVRTVEITSGVKSWFLVGFGPGDDPPYGRNQLLYWVDFTDANNVPDQLIPWKGLGNDGVYGPDDSWGAIGADVPDGISITGIAPDVYCCNDIRTGALDGRGRWKVKVENQATGLNPTIAINSSLLNGDTVQVTIQ